MIAGPFEQRNPYKGTPPRSWFRVHLMAPDGTSTEIELAADTGNPCAIIISSAAMSSLNEKEAPDMSTNFGLLKGGWLHVHMPAFGLDQLVLGYASDTVVLAAKASDPSFEGLAGLPLLRLMEYGGDANSFWIRPALNHP